MQHQDQLYRFLAEAEEEMAANERRLGDFRRLEPQLAELVGRGEGLDGWIRVTWAQTGLQDLDIDPRALRQPSDRVSRAVKEAITGAIEDLRAQTMEIVQAAGLQTPEKPDPEEAQRQMARFREEMMSSFRVSAGELDRLAAMREQYDPRRRRDAD